jgi:beta-lactam-binding protein with PASTA domain
LVPNLDGIAQAEAETIRTAAGLTGTTHRVIDGNNTGTVIGQSIAPGTVVAIGTALDLAISSNLMPDLVGELIQTAEAIILAAGLTLDEGITEEFSDAFAQGEVISQTPVADSAVAPGDPVTLTVSLGEAASVSPLSLLRGRRIYRNTRHALHSLIEDGGGEEEPTETIWNDIWGDIWDDIWADAA